MNKKYKPAGKYAIKTFNKKYKDHDRKKNKTIEYYRKFHKLQEDLTVPDVPKSLAWAGEALCLGTR